jgi:hypothetical protein
MSGIISIVTNFAVNANIPIDSRIVASNSAVRNTINYKYEGLKVYDLADKQSYIWQDGAWRVEYNGIYGGSGSLPGNVNVNFGTVPVTVGSSSNDFIYEAFAFKGLNLNSDVLYLNNEFIRHTRSIDDPGWLGVEFRQQFKYLEDGTTNYSSAYISYNPIGNIKGGIAFGTGDGQSNLVIERMRINGDGKVGIGTNDPKEILQIGSFSTTDARPLVIHRGGSSVIGYNWYYTSQNEVFDTNHGSTKLTQTNGNFFIQNREANTGAAAYVYTIYTTPESGGRVGILNANPGYALDVNGVIYTNNKVISPRYEISGIANTYIETFNNQSLVINVNNNPILSSNGSENFIPLKTTILNNFVISDIFLPNNSRSSSGLRFQNTNNPAGIFAYQGSSTNFTGLSFVSGTNSHAYESMRIMDAGKRVLIGVPSNVTTTVTYNLDSGAQIDTGNYMYSDLISPISIQSQKKDIIKSGTFTKTSQVGILTNGWNITIYQHWIRIGRIVNVNFLLVVNSAPSGYWGIPINPILFFETPFDDIDDVIGTFNALGNNTQNSNSNLNIISGRVKRNINPNNVQFYDLQGNEFPYQLPSTPTFVNQISGQYVIKLNT